jgi:hypothetical protein
MPRKLQPPFQYFIDECLGRGVRDAVTRALESGERVHSLADHFEMGTKDEVWLQAVGKLGWIVVTMDGKLRYRPNERAALLAANVAAFMVKTAKGDVMADRVRRAMPQIRTALRGSKAPLVGTIVDSGAIKLLIVGGMDAKKTIKPHGSKG